MFPKACETQEMLNGLSSAAVDTTYRLKQEHKLRVIWGSS